MKTFEEIREDLREIRYYYSMQKIFDSAENTLKPALLLLKVRKYHEIMKNAPAKLFIVFVSLYVNNNSQAALADDWGYSREYIKELNQQLCEYLYQAFQKEGQISD